jgi:hypothetical protein
LACFSVRDNGCQRLVDLVGNRRVSLRMMPQSRKRSQLRGNRQFPEYRRVDIDNPPLNLMGPHTCLMADPSDHI